MISAALLTLLAFGPMDSLPELRSCGRAKVPLGVVQSSGTVAFTVTRKGIADTGSVSIIHMRQGTPAGLRSALARQLPSCRFRPARQDRQNVDTRIAARVHFVIDKMHIEILGAAREESGTAAFAPIPTVITDTLESTDERLEELPRRLECRLVSREEIVTKVRVDGRVVDNSVPMMPPPSQSRLSPGEALMAFIVPVSGQVKAESVSVLRATSNAHVAAGRGRISNCEWAPGRVAGIPAPVRVVALERFN